MKVKAVQSMYYDRRMREPGDVYDMDDREEATAKLLEMLGKIEIVKSTEAPTPPPQYETAELKAVPPPSEPELPDNDVMGKRVYRRRDLRAEK